MKLLWIALPALACFGMQFLLPLDAFTFRSYEALKVENIRFLLPGPFYPNRTLEKTEVGDLGHHSPYARRRHVIWKTDEYGYRKEGPFVAPEIVIIGHSNTFGSGLTQEQTLFEQLEMHLGGSVYPYAGGELPGFLLESRFLDPHPKWVILECGENALHKLPKIGELNPEAIHMTKERLRKPIGPWTARVGYFLDQFNDNRMLAFLRSSLNRDAFRLPFVVGRDSSTLFLRSEVTEPAGMVSRDTILEILAGYRDALEERGIRFLFLPTPAKVQVLADRVPEAFGFRRSGFLPGLIEDARNKGILTVDTWSAFIEAHEEKAWLYRADDTHWSPVGAALSARLAADMMDSVMRKDADPDWRPLAQSSRKKKDP